MNYNKIFFEKMSKILMIFCFEIKKMFFQKTSKILMFLNLKKFFFSNSSKILMFFLKLKKNFFKIRSKF
ncbi:MAG: hypothetical protein B6I24_05410 [Bacteroidetes bacterium 4572_128]|nr:MAG: hypothetical protein B6I24_05410 [Bacteroidetes bacterium 4572_128]